MGNATSGVFTFLQAICLGGGIAVVVINQNTQDKFKELVEIHKDQFQLLDRCNKFLEKLQKEVHVEHVIQKGNLLARQNWAHIAKIIKIKCDIMKKIQIQYNGKKDAAKKFQNNQMVITRDIVSPILMFSICAGYSFYRWYNDRKNSSTRNQPIQLQNINLQQIQSNISSRRSTAASIQQEGTISVRQVQSHSSTNRFRQAVARMFEYHKNNIGRIVQGMVLGIRFLSILLSIYHFYLGIKSINQMQKQLNQLMSFFNQSENQIGSKFDKMKYQVILLMKTLAVDLYNFVHASKALALDLQQIIYLSIYLNENHVSQLLKLSQAFSLQKLGITEQLCTQTGEFLNQIQKIDNKDKNKFTDSLKEITDCIKYYQQKSDIFRVIQKFTVQISKNLTHIGYQISDFNQQNFLLHDKIQLVKTTIQQRNEQKIKYQKESVNDKKQFYQKMKKVDQINLHSIQLSYKVSLGQFYHGTKKFQLDIHDKRRIARMISLFTEDFYSDYEENSQQIGKTIYGIKIQDFLKQKDNINALQIIQHQKNFSNIIPFYQNQANKKQYEEFIQIFISQGKKLNEEAKLIQDFNQKNIKFRYKKLQIKNNKNKEQQSMNSQIIQDFYYKEGLMINVEIKKQEKQGKPEFKKFGIQRDLESGKFQLVKYSIF